jgi:hypothetical protein
MATAKKRAALLVLVCAAIAVFFLVLFGLPFPSRDALSPINDDDVRHWFWSRESAYRDVISLVRELPPGYLFISTRSWETDEFAAHWNANRTVELTEELRERVMRTLRSTGAHNMRKNGGNGQPLEVEFMLAGYGECGAYFVAYREQPPERVLTSTARRMPMRPGTVKYAPLDFDRWYVVRRR